MKYDDAASHYGWEFPTDLPQAAAATHIGMFVAWAVLNGLGSAEAAARGEALRDRSQTPGAWFVAVRGEKFTDADLSGEGNAFAEVYYGIPNIKAVPQYLRDYIATFEVATHIYYVEDSWANYDRVAPLITTRLAAWRNAVAGLAQ